MLDFIIRILIPANLAFEIRNLLLAHIFDLLDDANEHLWTSFIGMFEVVVLNMVVNGIDSFFFFILRISFVFIILLIAVPKTYFLLALTFINNKYEVFTMILHTSYKIKV